MPKTTASIGINRYCHQCNETGERCNSGAALTTTAAAACAPASNLQFQASVPSLDFASLTRAAVYQSQSLYVFSKITNYKIPSPSLLDQPVQSYWLNLRRRREILNPSALSSVFGRVIPGYIPLGKYCCGTAIIMRFGLPFSFLFASV